MQDGSCVLVTTTVARDRDAAAITDALLDERLAACVQAMPIASSYWWQGERCSERETLLLIKTVTALSGEVAAVIRKLHPYELPEICVVPIAGGLDTYLQWVRNETRF
jgi:periplasmic divalent cation tolerance protein